MFDNRLSYFMSVGKHLNFTKAAKECHIAQSAISQQIIALEEELGFDLFVRNSRSVILTPAGTSLLGDIKIVSELFDDAIKRAKSIHDGYTGNLSIGVVAEYERVFLPGMLREFMKKNPHICLTLHQNFYKDLEDELLKGIIDIIIAFPYDLLHVPELTLHEIFSDEICLLVNSSHPLAALEKVTLAMAAQYENIVFDTKQAFYSHEFFYNIYKSLGLEPKLCTYVTSMDILIMMIQADMGVSLMPKGLKNLNQKNLVFIDLEEGPFFTSTVAACKNNNRNPAISVFMKMF